LNGDSSANSEFIDVNPQKDIKLENISRKEAASYKQVEAQFDHDQTVPNDNELNVISLTQHLY
jgi:hypothetical protein